MRSAPLAGGNIPVGITSDNASASVAPAQKDERTLLLEHVVSRATSLMYASPEMRTLAEERLAEALTELHAFERARL